MCLVAWMQRKYPPMAHMGGKSTNHAAHSTDSAANRFTVELEMAGGALKVPHTAASKPMLRAEPPKTCSTVASSGVHATPDNI